MIGVFLVDGPPTRATQSRAASSQFVKGITRIWMMSWIAAATDCERRHSETANVRADRQRRAAREGFYPLWKQPFGQPWRAGFWPEIMRLRQDRGRAGWNIVFFLSAWISGVCRSPRRQRPLSRPGSSRDRAEAFPRSPARAPQ